MVGVPERGVPGAADEMVYPGLTRHEVEQWLNDLQRQVWKSAEFQRYLAGGPRPRDDDYYRMNELARLLWITKK